MHLSNNEKKQLRSIGHTLNPIVTVASKGLTENVVKELNRALDDHELIKVKLAVGEREAKAAVTEAIVKECHATLVQAIGHVILLHRRAKQPKENLTNLTQK